MWNQEVKACSSWSLTKPQLVVFAFQLLYINMIKPLRARFLDPFRCFHSLHHAKLTDKSCVLH